MADPLRVLICGTGNSAHVLAGLAGSRPDIEVQVLTRTAERAARWTAIMAREPLKVLVRDRTHDRVFRTRKPFRVSHRPEEVVPGAALIILAVPAFCHDVYLAALEPYLDEGATLVGLPGQNGFEFDVREHLGAKLDSCCVLNFESLPWICRVVDFGKIVRVSGTKDTLVGAMQQGAGCSRLDDPLATLQDLIGPRPVLKTAGHLLGITLRSPNAYSHPPIMYAQWKDWDGTPVEVPPLFYHGVDEEMAALLAAISDEVVQTSRAIMAQCSGVDLSRVVPRDAGNEHNKQGDE